MPKNIAVIAAGEAAELIQPTVSNYKVSTAASVVLGSLWVISNLEGCGLVASKVALVGALLSAGAAVNQYGLQNTQALISNAYSSFFNKGQKLGSVKPLEIVEPTLLETTEADEASSKKTI